MVTSVMQIAKFIPQKKNRKRDNAETINNDETEKRRQKTKIDWDLLRKKKKAPFNTELEHILEQQQQQQARTDEENADDDNTWTPNKGCPYKNLVEAIGTAAAKIAPSDGRAKRLLGNVPAGDNHPSSRTDVSEVSEVIDSTCLTQDNGSYGDDQGPRQAEQDWTSVDHEKGKKHRHRILRNKILTRRMRTENWVN
jgi:hypothetical protein